MAYGAYAMNSRRYDFSLFETTKGTAVPKEAPVKVRKNKTEANIVRLKREDIDAAQRRKYNIPALILSFVMSAVAIFALCGIVYGQVSLSELNQQIIYAENTLTERQSEQLQIQAKVDSSLSTLAVEEFAKNNLGMVKASNQQKEYVSLSQGDKAQVYMEEEKNLFEQIGDYISGLWS